MSARRVALLAWTGSTVALAIALCGCTAGGQFDPTEVLSTDIFNTKKKIQGEREPLFPSGVPGAETGVPPDLVKGYQPPPEQAADNAESAAKPGSAMSKAQAAAPKPKPKAKRKVAHAPAPQSSRPGQSPWPNPAQGNAVQTNWPPPPQPGQAQTNWPAPPTGQAQQGGQAAQTNWPAPPPVGQAQGVPTGQSIWPNPPAAGASSH